MEKIDNHINTDNLFYYTEKDYSEYAKAEEMVNFVTDIKDAALGNSSQEIKDLLIDRINEKKSKKFSIKKLFTNPFVGITLMINGCFCCGSAILSEDNFQTLWTTGVISVLGGLIIIYLAVKNIGSLARWIKNIFTIISK